MKLFPTPKSNNLSEWLELATNRLATPARKRIGLEIGEHYAEAVEAHLQEGLSETAAQAAALAELGDPWAAARRFRKQHLAEGEARCIESMLKNARNIFMLASLYIAFALLAYLTSNDPTRISYRRHVIALVALFLAWVALPTASFVLARRKSTAPNIRLLILMQSMSGFTFGIILTLIMDIDPEQPPATWQYMFWWIWLVSVFGSRFSIWRKLRKFGYFRDEMPPRDTATS